MNFNCQLIKFKRLVDGALRLEIDIPECDQQKVMSDILNLLNKSLICELEIGDNIDDLKPLRKDAYLALNNYAISKGIPYDSMHDKIFNSNKLPFKNKGYTSFTHLNKHELEYFINYINKL